MLGAARMKTNRFILTRDIRALLESAARIVRGSKRPLLFSACIDREHPYA